MLEPTKRHHTKSKGQVIFLFGNEEQTFYGTQEQICKVLDVISDIGLVMRDGSLPWRKTEVYKDIIEEHGTEGAAYLAGCRIKRDMTQSGLAGKLNIARQNVSEMERGKRPIGKKMAKRLAEIFDCDYRTFL